MFLAAALASLAAAAPAHGAGLRLTGIPGPNGQLPFLSPGGSGPTDVVSPPGDKHRLFVTTKDGYVYVVVDGVVKPTPVLNLSAKLDTFNENGMFSLVFDPDFANNRQFYVTYSDLAGGTNSNLDDEHLSAFRMSTGNPNVADAATEVQILRIPHVNCPSMSSPHYGGQLQFGPDGHLWLSVGDGADDCQSEKAALDLNSLHGKILRIDPRPAAAADGAGSHYAVPADNPLVGQANVRPEIWAYGLRNPYRFSFDASTHDVVIGDVGLSTREEVDRVGSTLATGAAPPFFGWPCMEGDHPLEQPCTVSQTAVAPLFVKDHGTNPANGNPYCTAVIGGYVLHDPSLAGDFDGRYLYGYFCANQNPAQNGRLYTTDLGATTPQPRDEGLLISGANPNSGFGLSSFGEDACGHPYAMNVVAGGLYRIEGPTPGPCGEYTPPQTSITTAPPQYAGSASATIAFASSVRGSTFACALDGAAPTPCMSPKTYSGLQDGGHTFTVAATDEAGNADASPAAATWTVEATPPQTTITAQPAPLAATRSASFAFSASAGGSTFKCSLDGAPATTCTSPSAYSDLADGDHAFSVAATNAVGTADASPATAAWTVDTAPPETTLSGAPPASTGDTSATFAFAASEDGSTFACSLDGIAPHSCSPPEVFTGLSPGAHSYSVAATDAAGNVDSSPAAASWTITQPPGGPSTSLPGGPFSTPVTPPAIAPPLPTLRFTVPARVRVTRAWRIPLALAALSRGGTLTLTVSRSGRRLTPALTARVLTGHRIVVHPRLSRLGRSALRSRRSLGVRVTATVRLAGGGQVRRTAVLVLRLSD
jgi:glucose/arabinose dehydrogenase